MGSAGSKMPSSSRGTGSRRQLEVERNSSAVLLLNPSIDVPVRITGWCGRSFIGLHELKQLSDALHSGIHIRYIVSPETMLLRKVS